MATAQEQSTSSPPTQWQRICRWLKRVTTFLWVSVIVVFFINVVSTISTSTTDTQLSKLLVVHWLLTYPIPIISGAGILLVLTIISSLGSRERTATSFLSPDQQSRLIILKSLRKAYTDELDSSLQGMARIALGLHERFDLTHPTRLSSWQPGQPERTLPAGTTIVDAYDQAGNGLLILGEPGAGKSTLLYDLAQSLLSRTEQDEQQPLPVILNLSSWATRQLPLEQWLVEELQRRYLIPRQQSQRWLQQSQLLPLLDGLDEVAAFAREACIKAINTYQSEHLVPLIVCSRRAEYQTMSERLTLQSAVIIQPLSSEQIKDYLARAGEALTAVQTVVNTNPVLQELLTTPLMLSVVALTYKDKTAKDLPQGSPEEQQRQIFERYVTQALEKKRERPWRYASQPTRKWLSWLAQQMQQRSLTEFYLERLQPSWLLPTVSTAPTTYPCLTTLVIMLLSAGLSFGLLFVPLFVSNGNPGWFVVGLFLFICTAWGYALGVPFGFGLEMMGFSRKRSTLEVRPAELLVWSWKGNWLKMLLLLVGVTLILPVGFHMPYWLSNLMGLRGFPQPSLGTELLIGLFLGVALVACIILITGVSSARLGRQQSTVPNQGIHNSGWNALRVGLACMVLFGLLGLLGGGLAGLSMGISSPWEAGPPVGLVIGAFAGPFFVLFFGGGAYLQHYILRFLLWRAGLTSWHYIRFLEEAKDRILLQRVGGGYRFIHPLFQQYFASLYIGSPSTSAQPLPLPHPQSSAPKQ